MAARTSVGRAMLFGSALLCMLAVVPAARAEDLAAPLYQPYAVDVIDLQLPQASIEALEADPEGEYVEGTFSLAQTDGTPGGAGPFSEPLTVGIRLKGGNGSFRSLSEKAAFKVKFNFIKGQKFLGLKKMTLNNMVQDPSMVHETMAYEAFRSLGVAAPRTGYVYLRVNGDDYGVYLDVETLDDVFLPHWFGSTRHLYEADNPGLDVSPGSAGEFEVDEGDEEDRSDLEALIIAANDEEGDWSDGIAPFADLPQMTRMWATERYIGHWDGYAGVAAPFRPNNYFLHSEDTGVDAGRFRMLPWGTDQAWEDRIAFDEPAGGLLFNHCFADESCAALYRDALRSGEGTIDALDLHSQATCLAELLAPWQAMEDGERREYDGEEIEEGVEGAREFIAERPGELSEWLATQPPEAGTVPGTGTPAPCGPVEPEPEQKPGEATGSSPQPPPPATPGPRHGQHSAGSGVRLERSWVKNGFLSVKLRLGQPGLVSDTATIGTAGGTRRVCFAHLHVLGAGTVTLSCRLSAVARRRLRARRLKLNVTIRFKPKSGKVEKVKREILAPRGENFAR